MRSFQTPNGLQPFSWKMAQVTAHLSHCRCEYIAPFHFKTCHYHQRICSTKNPIQTLRNDKNRMYANLYNVLQLAELQTDKIILRTGSRIAFYFHYRIFSSKEKKRKNQSYQRIRTAPRFCSAGFVFLEKALHYLLAGRLCQLRVELYFFSGKMNL